MDSPELLAVEWLIVVCLLEKVSNMQLFESSVLVKPVELLLVKLVVERLL
jgi:hypothetical protein